MPSASAIRAGQAYIELFTIDSKLRRGLQTAQKRVSGFAKSVNGVSKRFMAGGAAIASPLILAASRFASFGDTVDKMAARTGASTEFLSEIGFAAEQSGASLQEVEVAFKTMQRTTHNAARGLSTATDAFASLGLSVSQLNGLSPEQQFELIADRIAQIDDPGRKAATAMEIFGRAGQKLVPLLNSGSEGMAALRTEARQLGLSMNADQATAAAKLTDAINRLKRSFGAVVITIGSTVAPMLESVANRFAVLAAKIPTLIQKNQAIFQQALRVAAVLAGVGAALFSVAGIVVAVSLVFGGLSAAIGLSGTTLTAFLGVVGFALSPLGLMIAGLGAATYAFFTMTAAGQQTISQLASGFSALQNTAVSAFAGITAALKSGDLKLAGRIALLGLKTVWLQITDEIFGVWQSLMLRLETAFITFQHNVAKLWLSIVSEFKTALASVQNEISKQLIDAAAQDGVQGFIARKVLGVDTRGIADDTKNTLDEDFRREKNRREQKTADAFLELDAEQQRRLNDATQRREIDQVNADLAQAQQELAAAIAEAQSAASSSQTNATSNDQRQQVASAASAAFSVAQANASRNAAVDLRSSAGVSAIIAATQGQRDKQENLLVEVRDQTSLLARLLSEAEETNRRPSLQLINQEA